MGIGGDIIGVVVGEEVMPHGREEHNQRGSGQQQAYESRMKRQARHHRARSRVACGRRWGHLRWVSHRASSSRSAKLCLTWFGGEIKMAQSLGAAGTAGAALVVRSEE